jgi:hypothetical protein
MEPHDAPGHAGAVADLCLKASLHDDYARRGLQRAARFRADGVVKEFSDVIRDLA